VVQKDVYCRIGKMHSIRQKLGMWRWLILGFFSVSAYGQIDHSPRWGENKGLSNSYWGILSNRPSYGIYDKEGINFGNFEYVKAGHWLGNASYDLFGYTYTGNINTGFENFSNTIGKYFRSPSSTSNEADLSIYFSKSSGAIQWSSQKLYGLYRYNNYKYPIGDLGLRGYVNVNNTNITKIVILIHGHNDKGLANPYVNADDLSWSSLRNQLEQVTSTSTNWLVLGYDWAEDANNGSTFWSFGDAPVKSAVLAHYHGIHVADALIAQFPSLQKVQFISHSAGIWLARSAAKNIQDKNSSIKVQITALDPFIPSHVNVDSPLVDSKVSELSSLSNVYILENYYSVDQTDVLGASTSQEFLWLSSNVQKQVDWQDTSSPLLFVTTYYYGTHSGPVQWYADSIASLGKKTFTDGYYPFKANEGSYGWSKSIFQNEPSIKTCQTSIICDVNSSNNISASTVTANTSVGITNISDPINNKWELLNNQTQKWEQLSVTSNPIIFKPNIKTNLVLRFTVYNKAGYDTRDINIRVRSLYDQWAELSNGLTGANADALADISGNGVPNIIKYALGKMSGDKSIPEYNTSTLISNSKQYLKISVPRSGKPAGISIVPEVSSDLQTWKSTEAQTLTDTSSEYSARDLVPMDSATKRFIRLRFTEQ
jgi:hypothetical protein